MKAYHEIDGMLSQYTKKKRCQLCIPDRLKVDFIFGEYWTRWIEIHAKDKDATKKSR